MGMMAIFFATSLPANHPVTHHYQMGMDTFNGGGVTYGTPTYRVTRQSFYDPQGHVSPPEWNARWERWNRPGYFGGEASYHGVFDYVP